MYVYMYVCIYVYNIIYYILKLCDRHCAPRFWKLFKRHSIQPDQGSKELQQSWRCHTSPKGPSTVIVGT